MWVERPRLRKANEAWYSDEGLDEAATPEQSAYHLLNSPVCIIPSFPTTSPKPEVLWQSPFSVPPRRVLFSGVQL